jgi:hypothetical protein
MQATAFQEHPYHWPVMGYEDDMKNWNQRTGVILKEHTMQITVLSLVVLSKPKGKTISTNILNQTPSSTSTTKVHIVEPVQTLANEE